MPSDCYFPTYVINSLDSGDYTIGLFLDIQKAFDSIDHKILLDKLYAYGIRGVCNKLFESYLSNRLQYTTSNNLKSSFASIKQGIPQGSILGPLLFTLFINDLPSIFNPAHVVLYAYDSSIFFSHKDLMTLVQTINDKLFNLGKWLYYNRLHLNINKCHYILFHSRKPVVNFNVLIVLSFLVCMLMTAYHGMYILHISVANYLEVLALLVYLDIMLVKKSCCPFIMRFLCHIYSMV